MRAGRKSQTLELTGEREAGKGFFGILGRRWVTPGWADDHVRQHVNGWGGRAGVGCLPRIDIRRQEERVGRFQ